MSLCTVCQSERRVEAEAALVAGEPYRKVAARFGLGAASTYRHWRNHSGRSVPMPAPMSAGRDPFRDEWAAIMEAERRSVEEAAELIERERRELADPWPERLAGMVRVDSPEREQARRERLADLEAEAAELEEALLRAFN